MLLGKIGKSEALSAIWVKALGIAHVAHTWLWVWHWGFMPTNPEQLGQRMSTCDTVN